MGLGKSGRSIPGPAGSFNGALLPVYLTAFADTFGGVVQDVFPASLTIRAVLVVFLLAYILRTNASASTSGSFVIWMLALGYFVLSPLAHYLILLNDHVLAQEIGSALRLLYFPLLLNYLMNEFLRSRIRSGDFVVALLLYGYLILASLAIGEWSGLGGSIGGRGASVDAGKGFMIGANEVGLMLLLTVPFVIDDLVARLKLIPVGAVVGFLAYTAAGLYVFTKSSLAAWLLGSLAAYRHCMRGGVLLRVVVHATALLALGAIVYKATEYVGPFMEALAGTFFAALLDEGLVAFLMRSRETYIEAILPGLVGHDLAGVFVLFGAGEAYVRDLSVAPLGLQRLEGTTFEMDLFDLVACHGLIGLMLYAALINKFLQKGLCARLPAEVKLAVAGTAVHAIIAGHVVYSPQVTTLLALIIVLYSRRTMNLVPSDAVR